MSSDDARTDAGQSPPSFETVARLYLGNILYALEATAVSLDADGRPPEESAFYRGIARTLAEAYGREGQARS